MYVQRCVTTQLSVKIIAVSYSKKCPVRGVNHLEVKWIFRSHVDRITQTI